MVNRDKREHVLKEVQHKAGHMGRCSVGGHSWGSLSGGMGHELSWVGLSFHKCIGWLPLPEAAGITPRARRLLARPKCATYKVPYSKIHKWNPLYMLGLETMNSLAYHCPWSVLFTVASKSLWLLFVVFNKIVIFLVWGAAKTPPLSLLQNERKWTWWLFFMLIIIDNIGHFESHAPVPTNFW